MCAHDGIIYPGYPYKKNDKDEVILPGIEEQIGQITKECLKTLVVFIGGAADYKFQPLLKNVFVSYEQDYGCGQNRIQDVCYSEHGGGNVPPVMKKWFEAGQKIVLVGHSWGGDRVIRLAEDNPQIEIALLVTLDPVSRSKNGQQVKPNNVKRWLNVYIDYKVADLSFANNIARVGGAWEACQNADINISLNYQITKKQDGTILREKIKNFGHADADVMFYKTGIEDEVNKL